MNKETTIRLILKRLIEDSNKVTDLSRSEVDKAIIFCRGVDPRTVQNWFNVLWKFEYLVQPVPERYSLNLEKAASLDLPIESTLTHKLERWTGV